MCLEAKKRIEKLCKKKKKEWDKKLEGNLSDTQKQDLSYEKIDDVKRFCCEDSVGEV